MRDKRKFTDSGEDALELAHPAVVTAPTAPHLQLVAGWQCNRRSCACVLSERAQTFRPTHG